MKLTTALILASSGSRITWVGEIYRKRKKWTYSSESTQWKFRYFIGKFKFGGI